MLLITMKSLKTRHNNIMTSICSHIYFPEQSQHFSPSTRLG